MKFKSFTLQSFRCYSVKFISKNFSIFLQKNKDSYFISFSDKEYKWDLFNNAWVEKVKLSECPLNVTDTKINIVTEKANEEEQDTDEETEKPKPNKQDMSRGVYGYEGDTYIYTDAVDGTVYFWDKEKNAWFPKVSR